MQDAQKEERGQIAQQPRSSPKIPKILQYTGLTEYSADMPPRSPKANLISRNTREAYLIWQAPQAAYQTLTKTPNIQSMKLVRRHDVVTASQKLGLVHGLS